MDTPTRLRRILKSPAYIKASEDIEFLAWDRLRPIRLGLELLKPELHLQKHRVLSTVVVFGSTRILSPGDARKRLARAEAACRRNPRSLLLRQELEGARNLLGLSKYYLEARKFGKIVSERTRDRGDLEYVIATGGGPGIMEAANRGACDVGEKSIGFNITLPAEQHPNEYITPELCFQFQYFAIRKMHFLMRAKGMVAFPGGYGTLDELFEALTLVQTKKMDPFPIVLFGRDFWDQVVDFEAMARLGVIRPSHLEIFRFVETAEEAWRVISRFHHRR